jgi:hypothetical protein
MLKACFLILLMVLYTKGEDSNIAPNGCGSSNFVINNGLKKVGEGNLISCCNGHDDCYLLCYGKRYCDKKFFDCLVNACSNLSFIRKQLCLMDVDGMYTAVNLLGSKFYCTQNEFDDNEKTTSEAATISNFSGLETFSKTNSLTNN